MNKGLQSNGLFGKHPSGHEDFGNGRRLVDSLRVLAGGLPEGRTPGERTKQHGGNSRELHSRTVLHAHLMFITAGRRALRGQFEQRPSNCTASQKEIIDAGPHRNHFSHRRENLRLPRIATSGNIPRAQYFRSHTRQVFRATKASRNINIPHSPLLTSLMRVILSCTKGTLAGNTIHSGHNLLSDW